MKFFKLIVHHKNFSRPPAEDLMLSAKDLPGLKLGDIVEIYHPENEFSRLLMQVTYFKEDFQKDTISVEQSIATAFQLRTYADVYMNKVCPESVALDSIELTFKDQYMGRSEMWRIKNSLVNTCVYLNKKLEFCGGIIRCQVYEMWSQGDRVACGVITEDTKIVFRSSTSMVYLFLQMSSEMWDFDIHGDLYFEKAVNGFLADLFQKWKKNGSYHEVTIVLFSRTFYEAHTLDEFPLYMRDCLQQDYKGLFYEDFYRVVVQNERYDDWTNTLVQLRRLFTDYQKQVVEYHQREGTVIPRAVNSTAARGNFLEVLNMSLNVFEKHYLDRSFERTGQLSVVITPGVGVFEVDRELTNVTKQRIIDNGVGSDLVCVGEQPLHAVPLLKFHNKDTHVTAVDDYSMPHWINLSFYSTNKKLAHSNFIPRIKLPPKRIRPPTTPGGTVDSMLAKPKLVEEDEMLPNSVFDYDAYDGQVFQLPTVPATRTSRSEVRTIAKHVYKKGSVTLDGPDPHRITRKMSDPDIHHVVTAESPASPMFSESLNSVSVGSPSQSAGRQLKPQASQDLSLSDGEPGTATHGRHVVGSVGSPSSPPHTHPHPPYSLRSGKALINPFDPSHVTIKLTSNRRRWTHIFPKGPTGVLIQQHHYQAVPTLVSTESLPISFSHHLASSLCDLERTPSQSNLNDFKKRSASGCSTKVDQTLLWGATGEQEWTPALTTGVDWKSLTIPACLPLTTDYFPDKRSLQNDYLVYVYGLLPDDVNADFAQQRAIYKKPLTTKEVFRELVSQRLAQGFQLILLPPPRSLQGSSAIQPSQSLVRSQQPVTETTEEYLLSIGRIFHKISLSGSSITVTKYTPRHPYPPFNIHYRYRFQAPDHPTYEMSWVSFTTEKLENYNWNYLDHYICTRGDTDFSLVESLKYWRYRVYLMPLSWNSAVTKKIMEGAEHCDMYTSSSVQEQAALLDSFLRYIETCINKIKRPSSHMKPRSPPLSSTVAGRRRYSTGFIALSHSHAYNLQSNTLGSSPFRDRLGSSRLPEKPRPRSGSKVLERGRISPAVENLSLETGPEVEGADEGVLSKEQHRLKSNATFAEIADAMKHPLTGVGFFVQHASLPSMTFTSADAVQWLVANMDGIVDGDDACAVMNNMMAEKLVCHASGEFRHPFIVGFYLYHFCLPEDQGDTDYCQPLGDIQTFANEWLEVEVRHPTNWKECGEEAPVDGLAMFLSPTLEDRCQAQQVPAGRDWKVPMYKHVHLETDVNTKSDRIEWGHCKYHSYFQPDRAFELVAQWVAASGNVVADMVSSWARKSQQYNLQLVSLPGDPLSLPFTNKSDPLRGPVFVPLDTESLMGSKSYLFEEFQESTWDTRLVLLQEAIVQRFGFIPCAVESTRRSSRSDPVGKHHHQYVHLTGNIFILIPSLPCSGLAEDRAVSSLTDGTTTLKHSTRYPVHSDVVSSPHEEYITRHVNGNNRDYNGAETTRPGFLWFWNHMVSRRWKSVASVATGDEAFQNKILKDFREFCSNQDNRLKMFWDKSHEAVKTNVATPEKA